MTRPASYTRVNLAKRFIESCVRPNGQRSFQQKLLTIAISVYRTEAITRGRCTHWKRRNSARLLTSIPVTPTTRNLLNLVNVAQAWHVSFRTRTRSADEHRMTSALRPDRPGPTRKVSLLSPFALPAWCALAPSLSAEPQASRESGVVAFTGPEHGSCAVACGFIQHIGVDIGVTTPSMSLSHPGK